jgi:hypothetical protein
VDESLEESIIADNDNLIIYLLKHGDFFCGELM